MNAIVIVFGLLAIVAMFGAIAYAVSYNRLIAERQEVGDAWATIDVELQRRHALIPELVEAVSAAATHERDLLVELSRRNQAAQAAPHTPQATAAWDPPLASAVAEVVALRERYPTLNSQQNFLRLQNELAITEDRLAAARRFYNTRVAALNTRVDAFPSRLVAARHAIVKAEFFDE